MIYLNSQTPPLPFHHNLQFMGNGTKPKFLASIPCKPRHYTGSNLSPKLLTDHFKDCLSVLRLSQPIGSPPYFGVNIISLSIWTACCPMSNNQKCLQNEQESEINSVFYQHLFDLFWSACNILPFISCLKDFSFVVDPIREARNYPVVPHDIQVVEKSVISRGSNSNEMIEINECERIAVEEYSYKTSLFELRESYLSLVNGQWIDCVSYKSFEFIDYPRILMLRINDSQQAFQSPLNMDLLRRSILLHCELFPFLRSGIDCPVVGFTISVPTVANKEFCREYFKILEIPLEEFSMEDYSCCPLRLMKENLSVLDSLGTCIVSMRTKIPSSLSSAKDLFRVPIRSYLTIDIERSTIWSIRSVVNHDAVDTMIWNLLEIPFLKKQLEYFVTRGHYRSLHWSSSLLRRIILKWLAISGRMHPPNRLSNLHPVPIALPQPTVVDNIAHVPNSPLNIDSTRGSTVLNEVGAFAYPFASNKLNRKRDFERDPQTQNKIRRVEIVSTAKSEGFQPHTERVLNVKHNRKVTFHLPKDFPGESIDTELPAKIVGKQWSQETSKTTEHLPKKQRIGLVEKYDQEYTTKDAKTELHPFMAFVDREEASCIHESKGSKNMIDGKSHHSVIRDTRREESPTETKILVTARFFEEHAMTVAELHFRYAIIAVDTFIIDPIDIIVSAECGIILISESNLRAKSILARSILAVIKMSLKFSKLWVIILQGTENNPQSLLEYNILKAKLCNAVGCCECTVIIRDCGTSTGNELAMLISRICYLDGCIEGGFFEGFSNRRPYLELLRDDTFLAHCDFLQRFPMINMFCGAMILAKWNLNELVSIVPIQAVNQLLMLYGPSQSFLCKCVMKLLEMLRAKRVDSFGFRQLKDIKLA